MRLFIILLITVCIIILYYWYEKPYYKMTYVKSPIDNKLYFVRDEADKQSGANILARLRQNIFTLSDYLYANINKYKDFEEYIKLLHNRIQNCILMENSDTKYTSYTVNKGEELIICIRSRSDTDNNKLHDVNLLTYVVLHEMAHIACPEINHTPLFKKIFAFLVKTAIELNIYTYIDFKTINCSYCGMIIDESII